MNKGGTDLTKVGRYQTEILPMVEIFETVEGEGTRAGFPTTFVRVFHCNLRCTWCDTTYSYAPHQPEFHASIADIQSQVQQFGHQYVCLTGGEPLIHKDKSALLVQAVAEIPSVVDVHIETNGAIDLTPFVALRKTHSDVQQKVRFILDYKLPKSGETARMNMENYALLGDEDEIKFVIADEEDFFHAKDILTRYHQAGIPLFSPVWETMPPARLVELILAHKLHGVKFNLQAHKVIWDPARRGV